MRRDASLLRRLPARTLLAILLLLVACALSPRASLAEEAKDEGKVVRVGWYDSSYCYRDDFGRRRGVAYEYQRKVAAHTGWTYEYVEDSWPNLFQKLVAGEIDLLSDVSYTEERSGLILYASLPMGQEGYYAFVDADEHDITAEDLTSFDGKRIGVNKGSVQAGFLRDWAKANGIEPQIVELSESESASMAMLFAGKLDAYVSMDDLAAYERCVPVCQVGSSDFYFAVNRERPDLLSELNSAMAAIQDEDPFYNSRLASEYAYTTRTNAYLTPALDEWLKAHGAIRVGFRDNILPFCAEDPKTGEVAGALRDYFTHADNCLKNANVKISSTPFATSEDALDALMAGEVDCAFPVNLSSHDCEQMGILETNGLMKTEMFAITKGSERDVSADRAMVVALNEGNTNYDTFLKDYFPKWRVTTYPDTEACLRAVADGKADCTLLSNYILNDTADLRERLKLVAVPTGETMGLALATRSNEHELYAILDKTVNLTDEGDMMSSLSAHALASRKVSVKQFMRDNWAYVFVGVTAVFGVAVFLLVQRLRAQRLANERALLVEAERAERQRVEAEALRHELEQERQLKEVKQVAYTDSLTGVKSRNAYLEAERGMDEAISRGAAGAFGVAVFDVNDLKLVNDTLGHEAGDLYIKDACRLVCVRFDHSPVYRVGGDEFVAILKGQDYERRNELVAAFDALMEEHARQGGAGAGKVVVSCGLACYEDGRDQSLGDVANRADEAMYARKRELKGLGARDSR